MRKKKEKKKRSLPPWLETLKTLWRHPQYHAMIKLGLYFVFVAIVLIIIQVQNVINEQRMQQLPKKTALQLFSEYQEYTYTITITETSNTVTTRTIQGRKDRDKETLTVDQDPTIYTIRNQEYFVMNDQGEQKITSTLAYDVVKFTPAMLYDLIGKGTVVASTNYTSGMTETTYEVPGDEFLASLMSDFPKMTGNIMVKVQMQGQEIGNIIIDGSNYRKRIDPNIINSTITITIKPITEKSI
jgi:hypothetical protein